MSIHPPSDIILDVAKAADPARYRAAVDRLTRMAAPGATSPADASFDSLIDPTTDASAPSVTDAATTETADGAEKKSSPADAAKAYRGFEAMTLATFIEEAMPEDSSAVYGSGTAGGVWKSMLAEKIADQMAKAGGIGIAKQLAAFEKAAAGAGTGAATPAATHIGPTSSRESPFDPRLLVMTFERGFAGRVGVDPTATDDTSKSG